tara:strand:- start:6994 stop:7884 length:891 start_codon:yes stop_codon:yes gene_type:complete
MMKTLRNTVLVPSLAFALGLSLPALLPAHAAAAGQVAAVPAEKSAVDLSYKVYVGGFHVADINVDLDLAPENYDIAAKVKTSGMVGRMFPWWMQAYSKGQIVGAGVMPVSAGQRNSWKGRERFIDMKFSNGVARIDRIAPKPESDDRDKVPEDMRTGVVDLASAIVSIIRKMDGDDTCSAEVAVFDGRRRYDLIARPDGVEKLRPSGYTPYVGHTVNCELRIRKKVGFKKKDDSGWNDEGRKARVWMGKAFADVPPVPVRLTLNTPLGGLVAHLSAASHTAGGTKVKLGQSVASGK